MVTGTSGTYRYTQILGLLTFLVLGTAHAGKEDVVFNDENSWYSNADNEEQMSISKAYSYIVRINFTTRGAEYVCSGVALSPTIVLTNRHCITEMTSVYSIFVEGLGIKTTKIKVESQMSIRQVKSIAFSALVKQSSSHQRIQADDSSDRMVLLYKGRRIRESATVGDVQIEQNSTVILEHLYRRLTLAGKVIPGWHRIFERKSESLFEPSIQTKMAGDFPSCLKVTSPGNICTLPTTNDFKILVKGGGTTMREAQRIGKHTFDECSYLLDSLESCREKYQGDIGKHCHQINHKWNALCEKYGWVRATHAMMHPLSLSDNVKSNVDMAMLKLDKPLKLGCTVQIPKPECNERLHQILTQGSLNRIQVLQAGFGVNKHVTAFNHHMYFKNGIREYDTESLMKEKEAVKHWKDAINTVIRQLISMTTKEVSIIMSAKSEKELPEDYMRSMILEESHEYQKLVTTCKKILLDVDPKLRAEFQLAHAAAYAAETPRHRPSLHQIAQESADVRYVENTYLNHFANYLRQSMGSLLLYKYKTVKKYMEPGAFGSAILPNAAEFRISLDRRSGEIKVFNNMEYGLDKIQSIGYGDSGSPIVVPYPSSVLNELEFRPSDGNLMVYGDRTDIEDMHETVYLARNNRHISKVLRATSRENILPVRDFARECFLRNYQNSDTAQCHVLLLGVIDATLTYLKTRGVVKPEIRGIQDVVSSHGSAVNASKHRDWICMAASLLDNTNILLGCE